MHSCCGCSSRSCSRGGSRCGWGRARQHLGLAGRQLLDRPGLLLLLLLLLLLGTHQVQLLGVPTGQDWQLLQPLLAALLHQQQQAR
jgi:hypothetical protein